MNEQDNLQQQQIDRLIDGELTYDQVSALLRRCEEEPTAWRTMALRFLEAREVKDALKEMVTNAPIAERAQSGFGFSTLCLVTCCVVAAAFLTGWSVPRRSEPIAITDSNPLEPVEPPNEQRKQQSSELPSEPDDKQLTVVGVAQIHHRVGAEPPLQVISGPNLDHETLLKQPPRVPEHIERACRNKGLALQSVRRVMSIELADGQRFAIPLDKLGVRYVGQDVL